MDNFFKKASAFRSFALSQGASPDEVDSFIDQQAELELTKTGKMRASDIKDPSTRLQAGEVAAPYSDPEVEKQARQVVRGLLDPQEVSVDVLSRAAELGYSPGKVKTAEEKKAEVKAKGALSLIDTLEQHYQEGGATKSSFGPLQRLLGLKTNVAGAVGLNEQAKLYNDAKKGFVASLKTLTGDTGVLTEQDAERLAKLIPSFGSTKEEAEQKFNDLRKQIGAVFGAEGGQTTIKPKEEGLLDTLILNPAKQLKGVAQDIGTGVALQGKAGQELNQSQDKTMALASALEQAAAKENNPETKQRLLKTAQQARQTVNQGVQQTSGQEQFSPDIEKDYLTRGLETGSNIAAFADVANIAAGMTPLKNTPLMTPRGPLQNIGILPKGKSVNPLKNIGEERILDAAEADAQGKIIKIPELKNKIIEKITNSKNIGGKARESAIKMVEENFSGKGSRTITESLGDFTHADSYTSGGKALKTAAGQYNLALKEAIKEEWAKKAPGVLAKTKLFSRLYGIGRGAKTVTQLGGTVLTGAALLALLKGQKRQ